MPDAYLTPSQVANFFLCKEDHDIDNLKLNKLVFFSLGFSLALFEDKELFSEAVQAWAYGPIIPSLFYEFKHLGRKKIPFFSEFTVVKARSFFQVFPIIDHDEELDLEQKELILRMLEKIWNVYGRKTSLELVDITHKSGSPWTQIYSPRRTNIVIPRNTIKDYYNSLISDDSLAS